MALITKTYSDLAEQIPNRFFMWLGVMSLAYVLFFIGFCLTKSIELPSSLLILIVCSLAMFVPNLPKLLKAIPLPCAIFLLLYRFTSAIVGENVIVHIEDVIRAEQALVNSIPTISLQDRLYIPGSYDILDAFAAIVYLLEMPLPLLMAAYLFMIKQIKLYKHYCFALLILALTGFATYLNFPAMPPWLASEQGYLPTVHRILLGFYDSIGLGFFRIFYSNFNHHPVAAIPSLHMGFTVLCCFYIVWLHKFKGVLISVALCTAMLFSIVYLGEHYVVDALLGTIYAIASFATVHVLWLRRNTSQAQ